MTPERKSRGERRWAAWRTEEGAGVFSRALAAWALRGVLCAAPSFLWASNGQFRQSHALVGMLAGVLTWILAFAWVTTRRGYVARVGAGAFGWMLRAGANARAALVPLLTFWPDVWLGLVSIFIAQRIALLAGFGEIMPQNTFVGTYVTTLIQGTLVALTMLPLGVACWLGRALWRWQHRVLASR